ncbi:DUF6415 family natural product biosynthesis protein [Streptomyces violens]|uniref:DUF6415 family natural product biosynthesis protein n=1 Tax=Streptomyces violens TaxID=66377 RepID=UPI0012FEBBF8|nr:DUF6415 family natural product biosynthesis protein [Streptomyces violens]
MGTQESAVEPPTSQIRLDARQEIDIDLINATIELALAPGVSMPSRDTIDGRTAELHKHLRHLMEAMDFRAKERPAVRALYRIAHGLLDLQKRPTAETTHYQAWDHMRNLATITAAFRDLYLKRTTAL